MKFVIIGLLMALLIAGCVQKAPTPDNTAQSTKTVIVDEPVVEEEESKITGGTVVSGSTDILSDVSCDENRVVTVMFTNTGIEKVRILDVDFIVNGNLDQTPECDAETLAPGEGTLCSGLNALGAGKTNVVQVIMPDRVQSLKKVTCE